ncbi:Uma2 family endonuclease [Aquisphaera insulae]|uniref:Uma2 family endonuclease n=1 Tax=Aquisphaera insulae TaxID=2712864 RepID=UPI0013ECC0E0|nr:Uma2 family endonuclease [Aquisphaera insulae]
MSTSVAERRAKSPLDDSAERPAVSLAVPRGVKLLVTPEDFERLSRVNQDLRLERTAEGELVVMAPAAPDGSQRNLSLVAQLWIWNRQTGLGKAFESSAGFTLPNTAIRGPDASWMTLDRWEQLSREERLKFSHVCPDFVVELRSPSNTVKELQDKMAEYLAQGVRLGWMIDPIRAKVEIYRPGRPVEVLDRPATLSGEDVLPGFVLDLKGILFD